MSCATDCTTTPAKITIVRGSDAEVTVRLTVKETGEPFDLTGASQIKGLFVKSDDTVLTKQMTDGAVVILSATTGKLKVILTDTDTASLKLGEDLSFEIEVTIGSITSIAQFVERLIVVKRVFDTSDV